jgi:CRISPR/Cas system CSM-associated protein Csm3 (group 7 of RAMP superfamily)
MFKRCLNELSLTIELRPVDLLLIKEGRHYEDDDRERRVFHTDAHVVRNPPRPRQRDSRNYGEYDSDDGCFDMAFVFSRGASGAGRFYLPGSSLRGVLRSATERVIARWRPDLVSDPFVTDAADPLSPTDHQLRAKEENPAPATIYRHALPVERCFGHTNMRGRWVVSDGWLRTEEPGQLLDEPDQFRTGTARIEVRDGVGIDRQTGAARDKVKYQFEALSGGIFTATITLTNYEHWQPGLLAHALAAIDGGQVRVGYGTRRGLGRIEVAVKHMRWRWYSNEAPDFQQGLPRLRQLAEKAQIKEDYGWQEPAAEATKFVLELQQTDFAWEATLVNQESTNWLAEPWPGLARLLPSALLSWPKRS